MKVQSQGVKRGHKGREENVGIGTELQTLKCDSTSKTINVSLRPTTTGTSVEVEVVPG